jgi:hypothetical protein
MRRGAPDEKDFRYCLSFTSSSGSLLSELTKEQRPVTLQIINAIEASDNPTDAAPLMFLQRSAGTGKIFTVCAFLVELAKREKRVLIYGTKGIAVVQYPREMTVHSLFPLGIV